MNEIAKKAISAYGGEDLWSKAKSVELEFSASGWAFKFKHRKNFQRVKATMEVARPYCRITPIGRCSDITGVLDGSTVRLEDRSGKVIQERAMARQFFPGGKRFLYWDDMDMAYFANYAIWNYMTLPSLLMRDDIIWEALQDGVLEATFPSDIPTHCEKQRFRFDPESGLLVQHDYTADVMGRFAKAAHVIQEHSEHKGITFTSKRRVTPRAANGQPMANPTLIAIEVHTFHLQSQGL